MGLAAEVRRLLKDELQRQGPAGLVVWYDAGSTLSPVVAEAVPEDARLLRFDGSYLALRFALESEDPHLEKRWVVYVPEAPPRESWLRDWELAGVRWEVDFLEVLRRTADLSVTPMLVDLFRRSPRNARDLTREWESLMPQQPVNETILIDTLLAVALGLTRWYPEESILLFISGVIGRRELEARGLWSIFTERVRDWAGWDEVPDDEAALRRRLRAAALLSELVESLPELSDRFAGVLPASPNRSRAAGLARAWRDRDNPRAAYIDAARYTESEYGLDAILVAHEALLDVDVFLIVDHVWRREVQTAIAPDGANLREVAGRVAEIAERRSTSFWAKQGMAVWWKPIALAAQLAACCAQAVQEAESITQVQGFLDRYADERGWWRLDLWALELAAHADALSPEERTQLANPAWRAYGAFLDRVNRLFADAVRRDGWMPSQPRFWSQHVSGKARTAVFLADGLRYDLARHLEGLLTSAGYQVMLTSLMGVLPTVTEVGMSALLPKAETGLDVATRASRLTVSLNGVEVDTLQGRREWLAICLGDRVPVVNLVELDHASTKGVPLIVVLSREIDRFGTFAADLDPKGLLNMVSQVARGISLLRDQGFERFVIAADHGFLFLPPGVNPERVDAPTAACCSWRFAVGATSEGCVVKTAREFGLQGEEVLAFPPGLAVFALPGGVRPFQHGGLSLQECTVPVLDVRAEPLARKVTVAMEPPKGLTSRIASIRLVVTDPSLFAHPRRVVVDINGKCGEPKELGPERREDTVTLIWLEFDESPPDRVTVRLLDADSGQVLTESSVAVNMVL